MAKPIGQLLKESGIVNEEKIQYALIVQKTLQKRLGDVLLDLGFVTDYEVAEVLSEQSKMLFLDLKTISPSKEALSKIPYNFSLQNNVLPVSIDNEKMVVALSDPYNDRLKTIIQRFSDKPITYKVSPATELAKKIERFYYLAEYPTSKTLDAVRANLINNNDISVENLVNTIIGDAIDNRSSDIHISPTAEATLVSYRIDGVLHLFYTLPISVHSRLVSTVKVKSSMDIATTNMPQDGAMNYEFLHENYDFRISTVPTLYGENLVIRILGGHANQMTLNQVGFNDEQFNIIGKAVNTPFGIILATGPTGSGKTTTLYALLREINTMEKNVMTIEDPIEFKMPLIHQVHVNIKANVTFSSAIRSFLRQDPDVMLVGEIRDEETAALAARSALTGHLVLSTLHTNDAVGAISRLKDLGIGNFILSSSLTAVIAQRLVRKLCPFCKKEIKADSDVKRKLGIKSDTIYEHLGCEQCRNTGYNGRIAASEIILLDDRIKEMIADGQSPVEIKEYVIKSGVRTMKSSAVEFLENGLTDLYELNRVFGS